MLCEAANRAYAYTDTRLLDISITNNFILKKLMGTVNFCDSVYNCNGSFNSTQL